MGLLLADRHAYNKGDSNPVMKAIADDLRALADHVWETAGMTWDKRLGLDGAWTQRSPHPITLVQHRILSGFEYIAVRDMTAEYAGIPPDALAKRNDYIRDVRDVP